MTREKAYYCDDIQSCLWLYNPKLNPTFVHQPSAYKIMIYKSVHNSYFMEIMLCEKPHNTAMS